MLIITIVSEVLNERAFVAMMEDLWALPFLVAIYCLPDNPNPWVYYVRGRTVIDFFRKSQLTDFGISIAPPL